MNPRHRVWVIAAGVVFTGVLLGACRQENRHVADTPPPPSHALRLAADRFLFKSEHLLAKSTGLAKQLEHDLKAKHYDALEKTLARLDRTARSDQHYEFLYRATLDAITSCDNPHALLERRLLDYEYAEPKSEWAHLLLGEYYDSMACHARGYEWAKDVTTEQWRAMANFGHRAYAEYTQALSINPHLFPAYEGLIGIGDDVGSLRTITAVYEQSRTYLPTNYLLAADYMVALEPRWHGSYRLMYQFARRMRAHVDENPLFYILGGYAYADKASMAYSADDYRNTLKFYYEALQYGDYPRWLRSAGEAAIDGRNYRVAYAYYSRYVLYRPQDLDALERLKELTPYCNPALHPECLMPPRAPWTGEPASTLDTSHRNL